MPSDSDFLKNNHVWILICLCIQMFAPIYPKAFCCALLRNREAPNVCEDFGKVYFEL